MSPIAVKWLQGAMGFRWWLGVRAQTRTNVHQGTQIGVIYEEDGFEHSLSIILLAIDSQQFTAISNNSRLIPPFTPRFPPNHLHPTTTPSCDHHVVVPPSTVHIHSAPIHSGRVTITRPPLTRHFDSLLLPSPLSPTSNSFSPAPHIHPLPLSSLIIPPSLLRPAHNPHHPHHYHSTPLHHRPLSPLSLSLPTSATSPFTPSPEPLNHPI